MTDTTCPLTDVGNQFQQGQGSVMLKVNKMIADNYAMIGLFVLLMIAGGFIIWYFGNSFASTMYFYYSNKVDTSHAASLGNNSSVPSQDNYVYDDDEVPAPTDIKNYMEPGKKRFVKELEKVHNEYNQALDDQIRSMGRITNDAKVDEKVMYKTHDDYSYENPKY
jgi:hypothetical protein